jgi:outer membrane protein TolC
MGERERPELQIADATIKAIDFEEKSVRSEYLPRLLARGGYDYTKNKFQIHEEYWSINLLASINLFSGGSTKAQVAKLEATKARLRIEKTKLTEDVRLEIEKYYLDLINSLERISVTKGATAQAEENLRITRIKYTEGVGLATDVTDAITLLTLAQTNYYRSLYDYYRSEAGYVYSMGKDLKDYYSSGQRQVEQ